MVKAHVLRVDTLLEQLTHDSLREELAIHLGHSINHRVQRWMRYEASCVLLTRLNHIQKESIIPVRVCSFRRLCHVQVVVQNLKCSGLVDGQSWPVLFENGHHFHGIDVEVVHQGLDYIEYLIGGLIRGVANRFIPLVKVLEVTP